MSRAGLGAGTRVLTLIFATVVTVSILGCGLPDDTKPVLPPSNVQFVQAPYEAGIRYFEFKAQRITDSTSEYWADGTDVYYRIYANLDIMTAEIETIRQSITADTQNGYQRIVGLGYRKLKTQRNDNYLDDTNRMILIRLFDEGFSSNSGLLPRAGVFKGNSKSDVEAEANAESIPIRALAVNDGTVNKGFGFFGNTTTYQEANPVPGSGDADTNYTNYTAGREWFVNAYAVTVAINPGTLTPSYSDPVHLGYIRIYP